MSICEEDLYAQEAMRLQPVAAAPNLRVAAQDVRLSNGVVIPAGVKIELAQYLVMRSAAWGWMDGTSFIPVRHCFAGLSCQARLP